MEKRAGFEVGKGKPLTDQFIQETDSKLNVTLVFLLHLAFSSLPNLAF